MHTIMHKWPTASYMSVINRPGTGSLLQIFLYFILIHLYTLMSSFTETVSKGSNFWGVGLSTLEDLLNLCLPVKQGISPPRVLDTLRRPTERNLAHFSDSLGSEDSKTVSEQHGRKEKGDVCRYFHMEIREDTVFCFSPSRGFLQRPFAKPRNRANLTSRLDSSGWKSL